MKNKLDEIVKAIIKAEGINFRGVTIGSNMEAIEAREGNPFDKDDGSLPHYRYTYKLGEAEEITLYYNFYPSSLEMYKIELILKSYPGYYWRLSGGTDDSVFFQQKIENKLQPFLQDFTRVKEYIIGHFIDALGDPKIDQKDIVFNKPYQNFAKYSWVKDGMRLIVVTYLDDEDATQSSTSMQLKVKLTEA
ncbi:MAG: hypothetical protein JKY22_08470 [Flavobacteriaceae bacterium]|nr:hypothetical protein [Flavobacteriaceae bacterium]